jgi:hypothetical protein
LPAAGIDVTYFAGCSFKSITNPFHNWIFIKNSLFIKRFEEDMNRLRRTAHVSICGVTTRRKGFISGEQIEMLASGQGHDPGCDAAGGEENQRDDGCHVRIVTQLRDLTLKFHPQMNSIGELIEAVDPAIRQYGNTARHAVNSLLHQRVGSFDGIIAYLT